MSARVGVILRRNPLLTKPKSPYENTYYLLKHAEQKSESRPFVKDFYYKKGSTSEKRFLDLKELAQPMEPEYLNHKDFYIKDEKLQSLNRKQHDNIYLLLKHGDKLKFPDGKVIEDNLKTSSESLVKSLGELEHWGVGSVPIGVHDQKEPVYFMKNVIISGRVKVDNHVWLSKSEIKEMDKEYYEIVGDMLS